MEKLVKGDVVVVPFPFSDLTAAKKRPAIVLATLEGDDLILGQITSKVHKDKYAISLTDKDFKHGSLKVESVIRANRLFTADRSLILYKVGSIRDNKINEIIESVISIFRSK